MIVGSSRRRPSWTPTTRKTRSPSLSPNPSRTAIRTTARPVWRPPCRRCRITNWSSTRPSGTTTTRRWSTVGWAWILSSKSMKSRSTRAWRSISSRSTWWSGVTRWTRNTRNIPSTSPKRTSSRWRSTPSRKWPGSTRGKPVRRTSPWAVP